MTFNTFKSILQAHSDKDPKIATQEITSDVYEVIPYACRTIIMCKYTDTSKPITSIMLPRDRHNFSGITCSFLLNAIDEIEVSNSDIILLIQGNALNIDGIRYDADNNILIFYYEQIYLTQLT